MNPEFRRNLWLELTPKRMILMGTILALAFFAASLPGGLDYGPSALAPFLYYLIVVLWGTRNAALSVVGEIRDRTWDAQRLSSLGAAEMTWGKLFGSTAYNWFGGLICLAVIVAGTTAHKGPAVASIQFVYYVTVGVIAQAASFLASLIAVRRRQGHSRLEVFVYQIIGLVAAIAVYDVWSSAGALGWLGKHGMNELTVSWWGWSLDGQAFLLVSLATFAGWIFTASYREMRLELKMRNGPLVWLAFLAFIGPYVAGFDVWLAGNKTGGGLDSTGVRLALAGMTYFAVTYIMVLLEPKDAVQYRKLGVQFGAGRVATAFGSLQSWMMSYAATIAVAVALIVWIQRTSSAPLAEQSAVAAVLGFLTRDVLIVLLVQSFSARSRGELASVIILVALYALIPAILRGLHLETALMAFYVRQTQPPWLSPACAWAEALIVGAFVLARLSFRAPREAPALSGRAA